MVLGQVKAYQRDQENQKLINMRKMMKEKEARDMQIMELGGKRQQEK